MPLKKSNVVIAILIVIMLCYIVLIEQYKSSKNLWEDKIYTHNFTIMFSNYSSPVYNSTSWRNNNWRNLTTEEIKSLSNLGRILYLNEAPPPIDARQEKYKILVWKYGPALEEHLLYHFEETKHDPFEDCSATNCILTYEDKDLSTADIVLVHVHSTYSVDDLPPLQNKTKNQIWALYTEESPFHTLPSSRNKLRDHNGIFNWFMSYRMDAEIPIPYGRAILKDEIEDFDLKNEFNEWIHTKNRDVLVAILVSNCSPQNRRWQYVRKLKKYITVDAYGNCGTLKCPGHIESDCTKLDKYMFYLAFENSDCTDYLTEKLWWNAYHKNSIPIIMGPTSSNLKKLLPYHSYVNIRDFDSPKALAHFLLYLNNTASALMTYLEWKSGFTILNEHGYFKSNSYYYCRVCEALNYNSKEYKLYTDLDSYWSRNDCYPPWDSKGRH